MVNLANSIILDYEPKKRVGDCLLIRRVDDFGSAADNVKKLAEEIVGRCVGLPLQTFHFGYLMSGKDTNDPTLLELVAEPEIYVRGAKLKDKIGNKKLI